MDHVYKNIGMSTLINAADSYTIIGGSRMPEEVVQAMADASRHFVEIERLHDRVGERLAVLTRNEAAMLTSGAAAALTIATAACMKGPNASEEASEVGNEPVANEVIILAGQRNGFCSAIRQAGAKLVEIDARGGDADRAIQSVAGERTACLIYFDSAQWPDCPPLDECVDAARRRSIPVIVDAAAQLPPVDNLWNYTTGAGADLAIFSGGKTLRGPQSTGLIVGSKRWIDACRRHSSPRNAIGRPMKVGKEEMMGLLAAVERYVSLDHAAELDRMEGIVAAVVHEAGRLGLPGKRLYPGATGQTYPRAYVDAGFFGPGGAAKLADMLKHGTPSIWVAVHSDRRGIIINPLHLTGDEVDAVLRALAECRNGKPAPA